MVHGHGVARGGGGRTWCTGRGWPGISMWSSKLRTQATSSFTFFTVVVYAHLQGVEGIWFGGGWTSFPVSTKQFSP